MDKRYQVFVSSTYRDLEDERREVIQALLELDCIPAGMELFPASDEQKWDLITRVIDDCDYYIVIVGGRYGSVDEEGISYTEREFDYAVAHNIPVLGFVHAEPDEIPHGKSERTPTLEEKLRTFRRKVESRMCKPWRTASELGGAVSRSLVLAIKTTKRPGWVRANSTGDPEIVEHLRRQVDSLRRELQDARVSPPPGAERFASGRQEFTLTIENDGNYESQARLTWDAIIKSVGPLLFDEAPEHSISRHLLQTIYPNIPSSVRHLKRIRSDDFHTIITQLLALGIIRRSERKRSANDAIGPYWSLTPYGETCTMKLRAIPAAELPSLDS